MALTNTLKPQVDLPVWEWMRFSPAAVTALTAQAISTSGVEMNYPGQNRFIYTVFGTVPAFYRYDTYADSWNQLATPLTAPLTVVNLAYNPTHGYSGRVISCPDSGGAKVTLQIAGLTGQTLSGYKIHIVSGTGAGQQRTITNVADPVVEDQGFVTAITAGTATVATTITDGSVQQATGYTIKTWKLNQWRDYQVRLVFGSGQSQVRKIIYNAGNTITISDPNASNYSECCYNSPYLAAYVPAANLTSYQIESSLITVDSGFTVAPDNTSRFVIETGGIWMISSAAAAPFYTMQYYDIAADTWYYRGTQNSLLPAALATDVAIEEIGEEAGVLVSGTATGTQSARTFVDSTQTFAVNRYANYAIRITGGTGIGQVRTVLANNETTLWVTRPWDTTPVAASSTYEILGDSDKLYVVGNASAAMYQFSNETDQMSFCRQLDFGMARSLCARYGAQQPIGLTGIARVTTGVTAVAINAAGTGYSVNGILNLTTTGTLGTVRITGVTASTGAITSVALENPGSGYSAGSSATTNNAGTGGSGATITLTVGTIGTATTGINHNFRIGDSITISGDTAAAVNFNGTVTVLGVPAANTFAFTTTAAQAATSVAQSTTVLVDVCKAWSPKELVGKIIQIASPGINTTQTSMRRITDNTATTITVGLAYGVTPSNGVTKYVILDPKALGTETTTRNPSSWPWGVATGGTSTTLVDSTKNWPVNFWTGRKIKIMAGTGFDATSNEVTITSNDATTITTAGYGFTPDDTSVYQILENFGTATGTFATTTLQDTFQNWQGNTTSGILVGKRIKLLTAAGAGGEAAISQNTNNLLTYGALTISDANTMYAVLGANTKGPGTCLWRAYGTTDAAGNKTRYMYSFRGNVTPTIERYDIAHNVWEHLSTQPQFETYTTGSMYNYNGVDRIYFTKDATGRLMYYDIVKNVIVPCSTVPFGMGAALVGSRLIALSTADGLEYVYVMRHSAAANGEYWRCLIYW